MTRRPAPSPAHRRPAALPVAAGLALGLHLALGLAWWLAQQARTVSPLVQAGRPAWTVVAPRPAATLALAPPISRQNAMPRQVPLVQQDQGAPAATTAPRELPLQATATTDARPTPDTATSAEADASPPAAMAGTRDAEAPAAPQAEAPYYARSELDVGPAPQGPVLIAFPTGLATGSRHVGRMSLFIDETGTVRDVAILPTEPPLPEPMQDAARRAFLATHFAPGQRQGLIVRSRIDIEVSFDDRPLDSLEAEAPPPSPRTAPQRPPTSGA